MALHDLAYLAVNEGVLVYSGKAHGDIESAVAAHRAQMERAVRDPGKR